MMSVERQKDKRISSFDELGLLSDALVEMFTLTIDNKEIVPVLSTFNRAHSSGLKSVMKGHLRSPKRAPLPLFGISRGEVSPNMERAFSGRRMKLRDFSEDGVFVRVSGVMKPIIVPFNFMGLLEKMSQMDELTKKVTEMFHNRTRAFSVPYDEWGRVGCIMRLQGGVSNDSEVSGTDRVIGFSVSLNVEANFFDEVRTERLNTGVVITTTPVQVWEGDLP